VAGVNKVILLGRLGRDPEIRYTPAGSPVVTLNLATTESFSQEGSRQERTEWHKVIAWHKIAENCSKYLKKGQEVYVEGKLQTRSWEGQQGQKKYATEIRASEVKFLGGGASSNKDETSEPQPNGNRYYDPQDIPF